MATQQRHNKHDDNIKTEGHKSVTITLTVEEKRILDLYRMQHGFKLSKMASLIIKNWVAQRGK